MQLIKSLSCSPFYFSDTFAVVAERPIVDFKANGVEMILLSKKIPVLNSHEPKHFLLHIHVI